MIEETKEQVRDLLLYRISHCNGYGCECGAYYYGECACDDADWRTPQEVLIDMIRKYPDYRYYLLDAFLEAQK